MDEGERETFFSPYFDVSKDFNSAAALLYSSKSIHRAARHLSK
jgi:hypothetical protein